MTLPLRNKNVRPNLSRSGPARLTAREIKALEAITDPTMRKVVGELLRAANGNQENFDQIAQMFPIQPGNIACPENESESDTKHFWVRWLRGSLVRSAIRGFRDALGKKVFHTLRISARNAKAEENAWIQVFAEETTPEAGIEVAVGASNLFLLRRNEAGGVESDLLKKAELFGKGDLISAKGAGQPERLGVGGDGKILVADSTATTGLRWKTPKEAAAEGPEGKEGRWPGLHYTWLTNTEVSDPGAGKAKRSNTNSALRISEIDKDGNNVAAFLATWDDSTTLTNRGIIIVRQVGSPKRFRTLKITGALTDEGTWDSIPTELIAEGEALENEKEVVIEWVRTGDQGEKGEKGAEGKGLTGEAEGDLEGTWPKLLIKALAVTTAKIANEAVTAAKIALLEEDLEIAEGSAVGWKLVGTIKAKIRSATSVGSLLELVTGIGSQEAKLILEGGTGSETLDRIGATVGAVTKVLLDRAGQSDFLQLSTKAKTRLVFGSVTAAGGVGNGTGFTVKKTATGTYEITLTTELAANGIMVVSQIGSGVQPAVGIVSTPAKKIFSIEWYEKATSAVKIDVPFTFHVIG